MVDATVPRTNREEPLALPVEKVAKAQGRTFVDRSRLSIAVWAVIILLVSAFLVFGVVRLEAGAWQGRRMPFRAIWARFVTYLTEQGASPAVVGLVTFTAIATLIGSGFLLWVAFWLTSLPPSESAASEEEA